MMAGLPTVQVFGFRASALGGRVCIERGSDLKFRVSGKRGGGSHAFTVAPLVHLMPHA